MSQHILTGTFSSSSIISCFSLSQMYHRWRQKVNRQSDLGARTTAATKSWVSTMSYAPDVLDIRRVLTPTKNGSKSVQNPLIINFRGTHSSFSFAKSSPLTSSCDHNEAGVCSGKAVQCKATIHVLWALLSSLKRTSGRLCRLGQADHCTDKKARRANK